MRLVVSISTGAVVHRTPLITESRGDQLVMVMPSPEAAIAAAVQATGLDPTGLISWPVPDRETAESLLTKDLAELVATIEGGEVVSVASDPDYTPPAPSPDPVQARLEALESAVEQIPLNTPHNRRWLAQKERVKAVGIAYIQANPTCTQAEAETAITADLTATFPDEPLVISPVGTMLSYAYEAKARGYTSEATFEALRNLVATSSPVQLQAMLAVL